MASTLSPFEHGTPPDRYTCRSCTRCFGREDHLRRHELSHKPPKHTCPYETCGMRFHRKDVLQRHSITHGPEQSKTRRKPRRGIYPRTSPATTSPKGSLPSLPTTYEPSPEESWEARLDSEEPLDLCHLEQMSTPMPFLIENHEPPPIRFTDDSNILLSPATFCNPLSSCILQHPLCGILSTSLVKFREICSSRYGFIHPQTLHGDRLPAGLQFTMAAFGAIHSPESWEHSLLLHLLAVKNHPQEPVLVRYISN